MEHIETLWSVDALVDVLRGRISELQQQRDQLLAACRSVEDDAMPIPHHDWQISDETLGLVIAAIIAVEQVQREHS